MISALSLAAMAGFAGFANAHMMLVSPLTTDAEPTKSSKFRVIHSIQGGCPAEQKHGNLDGDDATLPDPFTYNYPIPSDIPAGNYTLAWSWMNRIGNRELYVTRLGCG